MGCSQERAWAEGEAATVALVGTMNVAAAQLVVGIKSVEHWVTWKAGVSGRAGR